MMINNLIIGIILCPLCLLSFNLFESLLNTILYGLEYPVRFPKLELYFLLYTEKLKHHIDFVAYTLEQPIFLRTKNKKSYIYASYLGIHKTPVKGMICLNMIGFLYKEKGS